MHDLALRYLSSADVMAALPPVEERLRLAERTMLGFLAGAQMPPKIGVRPTPAESFAHVMPAFLPGAAADGSEDLLGVKWVLGAPDNVAAGLPAIHATTIMSDPVTGMPRAFLDAGALTAQRTAAISGLAIAHWGPPADSQPRVALIGAGAQARSHLPVVAHLLPAARIVLCDREPARAESLARELRAPDSRLGHFAQIEIARDAVAAVEGADVVLTLASFGPRRQAVPLEAFGAQALVVAVDYDVCVPAALATTAALFLVDHREQYRANLTADSFAGYPDDPLTLGEALRARTPRPAGRVLVTHLGVGLADVVFADAVLRAAEAQGIGTVLPR